MHEGAAYQNELAESNDRRVGPIEEKFTQLSNELEHLETRINRLISRIDPILSPDMEPTSDMKSGAVGPVQSSIAGKLDSLIRDANRMVLLVTSAENRVEA